MLMGMEVTPMPSEFNVSNVSRITTLGPVTMSMARVLSQDLVTTPKTGAVSEDEDGDNRGIPWSGQDDSGNEDRCATQENG